MPHQRTIRAGGPDSFRDHIFSEAGRDRDVTDEQEQLMEAGEAVAPGFVKENGTALVKIIGPGWGSSGYYGREMLERDAGKAYVAPIHMHIDHPTAQEEKGRPERSLRTLAGFITGAAQFRADGPKGPGVYAEAKILKQYRDFLNEMAPYIGVSHRAFGKVVQGTAEGRTGKIIESLERVASVDFVTRPGAGGALVEMYEAYRGEDREHMNTLTEAAGCKLALGDVFPGKQWGDLSAPEKARFRGLHAWTNGDGLEDCHLPIKGPDGAVKPECVRNALARLNQVQGLSGDAEAAVRGKLENLLNKINKEALSMEMKDIKLEALREARPDIVEAILKEAKVSEASKQDREKAAQELETLRKTNADQATEITRLREAQAYTQAGAAVQKALAESKLPEVTKARLQESLPRLIALKEGKPDLEAFKKTIEEAVKQEADYVAKLTEAGKVRGNGTPGGGAGGPQGSLKESMKAIYLGQGLSEAEAEKRATIAAAGR